MCWAGAKNWWRCSRTTWHASPKIARCATSWTSGAGTSPPRSAMSTADLTATELIAAYRSGELSPVQACQDTLDRIEAVNPAVNAYLLVDPERALAQARESESRWQPGEPRGLVDGVPTSIKDILLTDGWPTLRGSKAIDPDQEWKVDAPSVARLREHGAVLVGKTTTPELGWKGVTDSPVSGGATNPWGTTKTRSEERRGGKECRSRWSPHH